MMNNKIEVLKNTEVKEVIRVSQEVQNTVLGMNNAIEGFSYSVVGVARPEEEILTDIKKTFLFEIKRDKEIVSVLVYFEKADKFDYKIFHSCKDVSPYGCVHYGDIASMLSLMMDFPSNLFRRDMEDIKNHKIGALEYIGWDTEIRVKTGH